MAMHIRYCIKKLADLMTILFVIVLVLAVIGVGSVCCRAADKVPDTILITLEAKDKPLSQVLQKITQTTGYTFLLDEKWKHLPVTVSLEKIALHEGLRVILQDFSTAIIVDDVRKKTITLMLGNIKADQAKLKAAAPQSFSEQKQSQPINAPTGSQKNTASLDVQVIPPTTPGAQGITLRAIQDSKSIKNEIEPEKIEVIPPSKHGEPGITLKEIEQIRSRHKPIIPEEAERVPNE
jgi:hypothetical protein